MEEKVFNKGLIELATLLNKNIQEEELPIFYAKLKFIPDEAWPYLIEKAADHWDSWPRNFVKGIKFFWYDWQRGRKAKVDFQDCEYCYKTGVLDYHPVSDPPQSCFCGHCNNYLRHVTSLEFTDNATNKRYRHSRLTVQEITEHGWKWDAPPPPATREEAIAAHDEMMDRIDARAKEIKIARYQQVMFDQERQPHDDDFLEKLRR